MAVELLTGFGAQSSADFTHRHMLGSATSHTRDWSNMYQDQSESKNPSFDPNTEADTASSLYTSSHAIGYDMSPQVGTEEAAPTRKRKTSKPKLSPDLRRTASTPQLHIPLHDDTSPLASPTAEKRRNKLGYHRTSVACGHCRRRKIRCLVAPEDVRGRCLNCIRLKKDCHFFPVEQGPSDPKGRPSTSSEAGAKPKTSPDVSSPRASTASDSVDDLNQSQVPFQSPTFSYGGMSDSQWSAPTFYHHNQPPGLVEDPNSPQSGAGYWSPITSSGSTMDQHRGSIVNSVDQPHMFAPAGEHASGWGAMRSMSMGDASSAMQRFQHGVHTQRYPSYATSPYPYHFSQTSGGGMVEEQGIGVPGATQMILPSQPLALPSQSLPHEWSPYGEQTTPVAEHNPPVFSTNWYAEPSAINVIEEGTVAPTEPRYHSDANNG